MNNKISGWLSIILMAVIGSIFIAMHNETNLFQWLVRALGVCLLIPGAYVLLHSITVITSGEQVEGKEKHAITFSQRSAAVSLIIVSAAAIVFGLWMIISPVPFVHLFVYLLASILLLWGLYMLLVVMHFCRPITMPWQFYITPCLFVLAGIVLFVVPVHEQESIVALLVGILMIISAVNSIAQHIAYRILSRRYNEAQATASAESKVVDIDHQIVN